jgi:hypothetical protein
MAMRAVTRELVELTVHVTAQALPVADSGQLCRELTGESFNFMDYRRICRHSSFLTPGTDNFVCLTWSVPAGMVTAGEGVPPASIAEAMA